MMIKIENFGLKIERCPKISKFKNYDFVFDDSLCN